MSAAPVELICENTRLLVDLLRQPAARDLRCPAPRHWDWRAFAAACDRHNVASIVFCRLRDLGIAAPLGLVEHLRSRFYEISARNYHLAKKLVELTARFEERQIPVLAYKGPAVAMVAYGDLALRQYHDLDLVVREEHLLKAAGLMNLWRFESVPHGRRIHPENPKHLTIAEEIPFHSPDRNYFVDLHWNLGRGSWRAFSPDVNEVWDQAGMVDLPHGSVPTFCREDLFLALCSHGTKHRWYCLKWLLDVAQLLRKSETLDWSRMEEMTSIRPGACVSASLAVLLASELLDAPILPEAERVFPPTRRVRAVATAIRDELQLRGRTSGDYYRTLLELEERPRARMKCRASVLSRLPVELFKEVFVELSFEDRALIHLPQKLHFLYHLVRPVRLVAKYGRRVARKFRSMVKRYCR